MSEKKQVLETALFGPIQVEPEKSIRFPEGIVGFPECKDFVLLTDDSVAPFQWLQSLDEPALTFSVLDPLLFLKQYRLEFMQEQLEVIGTEDIEKVHTYLVVVLSKKLEEITINLKGPILLNPENRLGVQIINDVPEYSTKHKFITSGLSIGIEPS